MAVPGSLSVLHLQLLRAYYFLAMAQSAGFVWYHMAVEADPPLWVTAAGFGRYLQLPTHEAQITFLQDLLFSEMWGDMDLLYQCIDAAYAPGGGANLVPPRFHRHYLHWQQTRVVLRGVP